ncbi:hypothetical protein IA539_06570 [Gordonia sp. zg691]|uniref:hypothetical protein n=1 Tax=Gordonia jinghuaiqii TaxID=2758710 RepID=UPI0016626EE7|nr:hypothetical protein [Gordonia jinghuaiqii]MBD0860873.1 hypothetical protein [Gordonia jinghuaiqii]
MTHPGGGDNVTRPFTHQPNEYDSSPGFAPGFGQIPGPGMVPAPGGPFYDPAAAALPEQPLVVIGDITCTQHYVITPSGTFPIAGSQWEVTDMSVSSEQMSQTGLVLALVGFFLVCFLSLLFLLMKERRITGHIQVRVRGAGGGMHVTNIPATSPWTMSEVSGRVYYARNLAAMA